MDTSVAINKRRQQLGHELTEDIRDSRKNAKVNHLTSVVLMVIALLCSVVAAVFGLILKEPKTSGALAILPPLIAFIVTNLKLDGKACWYFNRVNAFEALRSRLLYELPEPPSADNIAAVSHDRTIVVETLEKDWDQHLMLDWSALSKPPTVTGVKPQSTESSGDPHPAKPDPEEES
jgi:hypothetical protein